MTATPFSTIHLLIEQFIESNFTISFHLLYTRGFVLAVFLLEFMGFLVQMVIQELVWSDITTHPHPHPTAQVFGPTVEILFKLNWIKGSCIKVHSVCFGWRATHWGGRGRLHLLLPTQIPNISPSNKYNRSSSTYNRSYTEYKDGENT